MSSQAPVGWRRCALIGTVLLALVTTGCGAHSPTSASENELGSRLADVTPVDNPREHIGPSTALLAQTALTPITEDAHPQLPVTVVDSQGTEVTITDVDRILPLDLYGTSSRVIYQLGLGDNIVGRDISSSFAEIEDVPLATVNGHQLNGEAILDLNPSLIITDTSLGPWDVILQMRDSGIPVLVIDGKRDLDNVDDIIMQIADGVGLPDEGRRLAEQTEAEIEDVQAQIEQILPPEDQRLRTVFLYVRGQSGIYYMFGPGSGTDALIDAVGGVDVAKEIGWEGMRPVTDEGIIQAQPELILVMTKGLESVGGVEGLFEQIPALALTPAGEKRRVVDMADTDILSFGPTSAGVLEALAVAIYAPQSDAE